MQTFKICPAEAEIGALFHNVKIDYPIKQMLEAIVWTWLPQKLWYILYFTDYYQKLAKLIATSPKNYGAT